MRFLGTLVNAGGIVIGSLIGVLIAGFLQKHPKVKELPNVMMKAVGLCVIYIGISGMLKDENTLVMILCMVVGTVVGELFDIDKQLNRLGAWVERKMVKSTAEGEPEKSGNIAKGFVSATLLFCVGAMAITGAINSGLSGGQDQSTLYAKSILDAISSVVFGATLGIGTIFSAISVLIYQGLIELGAGALEPYLSQEVITEVTSVGSVLIFAIGLNMTGIAKLKIANMLPAIFLPPLFLLFL